MYESYIYGSSMYVHVLVDMYIYMSCMFKAWKATITSNNIVPGVYVHQVTHIHVCNKVVCSHSSCYCRSQILSQKCLIVCVYSTHTHTGIKTKFKNAMSFTFPPRFTRFFTHRLTIFFGCMFCRISLSVFFA